MYTFLKMIVYSSNENWMFLVIIISSLSSLVKVEDYILLL